MKPVISVDDNQEVSLLIGADCVRVLEPREVISSQNGGAYAFQTQLGWCVLGPMINQTKAAKFGFNRIMLASAGKVKPGRYYCANQSKGNFHRKHVEECFCKCGFSVLHVYIRSINKRFENLNTFILHLIERLL